MIRFGMSGLIVRRFFFRTTNGKFNTDGAADLFNFLCSLANFCSCRSCFSSSVRIQSFLMLISKHFFNRQYVHCRRVCILITQEPENRHFNPDYNRNQCRKCNILKTKTYLFLLYLEEHFDERMLYMIRT